MNKKSQNIAHRFIFIVFSITVFLFLIEMAYAQEHTGVPSAKTLKALEIAQKSLQNKDYNIAVRFSTIAISDSPNYIPGYLTRARVWVRTRAYVNAIQEYTHILQIEPKKYPSVYRYRGDCLLELGHYQRAITDYSKSLYLNPKLYKSLYYRARAYALIGQNTKALKDIQRGLALKHQHADWFLTLQKAILTAQPIPYNPPVSN